MITATITMHGYPGKRMEILQTIKGIKEQLGKETRYTDVKIYQDVDDGDTFFLVEDWPSEHELDEYFSSRLFKVLLGLNPILKKPLEVKLLTMMRGRGCLTK